MMSSWVKRGGHRIVRRVVAVLLVGIVAALVVVPSALAWDVTSDKPGVIHMSRGASDVGTYTATIYTGSTPGTAQFTDGTWQDLMLAGTVALVVRIDPDVNTFEYWISSQSASISWLVRLVAPGQSADSYFISASFIQRVEIGAGPGVARNNPLFWSQSSIAQSSTVVGYSAVPVVAVSTMPSVSVETSGGVTPEQSSSLVGAAGLVVLMGGCGLGYVLSRGA